GARPPANASRSDQQPAVGKGVDTLLGGAASDIPGGTSTSIDLGKHGTSPGDEFLTTNAPLLNPQSHHRVGRAEVIETAMSQSRSALSVNVQLHIGTLQVVGVIDPRTH